MKQYLKILAVIIAFEVTKQILKDYEATKLNIKRIEYEVSDIKREVKKTGTVLL